MPFIPVENVAMAEIRMLVDAQKVENTLYFLSESGWDGASLESLGGTLHTWWTTFYSDNCNPIVSLNEIVCTDLTTATGAQFTTPGAGATGGRVGTILPNSITLAISFKTAKRGRAFRGRNYVVGLNEEDREGTNAIDAAVIADWIGIYDNVRTGAELGDTFPWVVVSRFSGVDADHKPIPRVAGIATRVTSVTVADAIIDAQRRRLPGRGQ